MATGFFSSSLESSDESELGAGAFLATALATGFFFSSSLLESDDDVEDDESLLAGFLADCGHESRSDKIEIVTEKMSDAKKTVEWDNHNNSFSSVIAVGPHDERGILMIDTIHNNYGECDSRGGTDPPADVTVDRWWIHAGSPHCPFIPI